MIVSHEPERLSVRIIEAGKTITLSDNRQECTLKFRSDKARKEAAAFLKEYRQRFSHISQNECQKRIGQALAVFSGEEIK